MGQPNSKPVMGSATPHVPKDRIQAPVPNVSPSLSVPIPADSPLVNSTPQNSAEVDEATPISPSSKQRRDSNRAPSSIGYYTNTVVDTEELPSSCRQPGDRRYSLIKFPTHRPSPSEDEFTNSICDLINGEQAFQRHPRKTSLEIICPDLNKLFRSIADPSNTYQEADRPPKFTVSEPYDLIFHIRKKILQGEHEIADNHSREHVQALFNFIQKQGPVAWEKFDEIHEKNCYEIAFKELWLLYPRGETVLNRDDGTWRAYKVDRVEINSESNSENMVIHCWFLDFDKTGKWLVPRMKIFNVPPYSSERPVRTLNLTPLWCHEEISQTLIERGKKYWDYGKSVSHKQYDGDSWPRMSQEDSVNVIIDYVTSSKHRPSNGFNEPQCSGIVCSICQAKVAQLQPYPNDAPHDVEVCGIRQAANSLDNDIDEKDIESLMFCPSHIWAFSLRHKSWKMIQLLQLSEVQCQSESFDKLQMNKDKKKDLEQLLCGHFKNDNSNLDLIKGKGQGLNIVLHGNPGTGKTLTVESICEKNRIPLYMLTCGELGNDTDAFEDRLQMAFLRAANWRAILLLEEADIFVRRRERDIQHCAIVSSFLSKLDYSRAVVFMATNRVKLLDNALSSRAHIKLEFPDFSIQAQKEIWQDAISRLHDVKQDDREKLDFWVREELEGLYGQGHLSMNGRQIRNCISAAVALARGKKETWDGSLKELDVRRVLSLGKDFMEFVRQGDTPNIGAMMEERDRKETLARQVTL